jgi:aldehyde:ferredoxin oxidoreductase
LNVLWVDLARRTTRIEKTSDAFAKTYLGERGFNSRRLWDLVEPEVDALSPENFFLIGVGPLCGTLAPASSRFTVSAKSPLTDVLGGSNSGGYFGPELRYAGYSQIIVCGRSETPVYLWVDDEHVEIRDATNLWRRDTRETQELIAEELGDPSVKTVCIGQAGENLVRYASILSGLSSAAGRTGMGAVMGSKNLKAVTARGSSSIEIAKPEEFELTCKEAFENIREARNPNWCTLYLMELNAAHSGGFKVRGGQPDEAWTADGSAVEALSGHRFMKDFKLKMRACFNCPVHCKPFYKVGAGKHAGVYGEGVDYGYTSIGPSCDLREMEPILHMADMYNMYGIDAISFQHIISWAMSCYENGIITDKDTGGLRLTWGNSDAMVELVSMVAKKDGIGRILAEGEKRAPKLLGRGSERYMYHIKGMSMGPPRIKGGHAPGYITSTRGADHLRALFVPSSLPTEFVRKYMPDVSEGFGTGFDSKGMKGWGRGLKLLEDISAVVNSVGLCIFPNSISVGPRHFEKSPETIAKLLSTATGFKFDAENILRAGERIYNVEKAFNSREGLTIKDDDYKGAEIEPQPPHIKQYYMDREELLKEYYQVRGWDFTTGFQTMKRLEELGLDDVACELQERKVIISGR